MTSVIAKPLTRYRAAPSRGGHPNVDREGGDYGAGLIRNVSIITRGEALGHGEWIDQFAVDQVVRLGKSARKGVKARFTHPSLSADGLGTFLGRFKAFKSVDKRAAADLHISKAAHETPDGDLAKYVMDLAEEDPEAFATSIVFWPDYGAMDRFVAEHEDEDGNFTSPDDDNSNSYPHMRISQLLATDVVDEPAANPGGLFRKGHAIAEEADALCEFALGLSADKPTLHYLSADADRIAQYAARFLDSHQLEIRSKDMADNKPTEAPAAVTLEQYNALKSDLDALKAGAEAIRSHGALLESLAEPIRLAEVDHTAAERKRCLEIFSLSEKSGLDGFTQLANDAIAGGLTVEQFGQAIAQRRIASNGVTKDSGEQSSDPDAKYKKEYAAQRAAFAQIGVTEKEYITSKKVDDGSELLAPGTAAA